jgi:hypothetical protein
MATRLTGRLLVTLTVRNLQSSATRQAKLGAREYRC